MPLLQYNVLRQRVPCDTKFKNRELDTNKFSKFRNLKFDGINDQILDNEFLIVIWIQFEFKIADERSTVHTIKF